MTVDFNKPLETADHEWTAEILKRHCPGVDGDLTMLVLLTNKTTKKQVARWYYPDGDQSRYGIYNMSLVNSPQRITGWVRVYDSGNEGILGYSIHPTRAEAEAKSIDERLLGTIFIDTEIVPLQNKDKDKDQEQC